MDLPTPPTDNLYKFLAIAGLIVVLGPGYVLNKDLNQISEERRQITAAIESEAAKSDFRQSGFESTHTALENMHKVYDNLQKQANGLQAKLLDLKGKTDLGNHATSNLQSSEDYTTLNEELLSTKEKLAELDRNRNQLTEWQNSFVKDTLASEALLSVLRGKNAASESLTDDYIIKLCIYLPIMLAGITMSIAGFVWWHRKVQKLQDQLLEAEVTAKLKEIAPEPSPIIGGS